MLFLGVAIHGICYDFFFVTGFMYTDRAAPEKVRGQAQSMLVFFTQGIGMWIGYKIAFSKAAVLETSADLQAAIADGRAEGVTIGEVVADPTYFDRIKAMFSIDMPESVDSDLIAKAMGEWQSYWLLPAGMAAVIAVLFFVAFRDTSKEDAE